MILISQNRANSLGNQEVVQCQNSNTGWSQDLNLSLSTLFIYFKVYLFSLRETDTAQVRKVQRERKTENPK